MNCAILTKLNSSNQFQSHLQSYSKNWANILDYESSKWSFRSFSLSSRKKRREIRKKFRRQKWLFSVSILPLANLLATDCNFRTSNCNAVPNGFLFPFFYSWIVFILVFLFPFICAFVAFEWEFCLNRTWTLFWKSFYIRNDFLKHKMQAQIHYYVKWVSMSIR